VLELLRTALLTDYSPEIGRAAHPVGERVARPQRPLGDERVEGDRPSSSASLANNWSVCHLSMSSFQ
jgi:hypothetical protein